MKIHFFIFSFFLFFSCGFFSQKDKNKVKAKTLLSEITTRHEELRPRIEQIISFGEKITKDSLSPEQVELITIGNSADGIYKNWKKDFERFQQQEVYMNYDLQVIRLEKLEEDLEQLEEHILK